MKVSRHAKIIELISQYDIETQEELAEYLNNAGFKVTQATVSRDIRDLKLTKLSVNGGRQKYIVHRTRVICRTIFELHSLSTVLQRNRQNITIYTCRRRFLFTI